MDKCYHVRRCLRPNTIDGNWDKVFWQGVEILDIDYSCWSVQQDHIPKTEVKLQYDTDNLYVIFRVEDRFVRAAASELHGEVWKDSCVEFFVAPYGENSDAYINIETNCIGTLLVQHHTGSCKNSRYLGIEDCEKIPLASSISGPIQNEIDEPITWTLEYVIPFEIFSQYTRFVKPESGTLWRANFYKCADDSSHPHWLSWSPVLTEKPDFHQPGYFGVLEFG